MNRLVRLAVAAVIVAGMASAAAAKDRLSVGLGFGYKIDANQLGETISTDGLDAAAPRFQVLPGFEGSGDPVPELAFLDQSVIVPENTLTVLENTGEISDLKPGGAIVAMDIAVNLRYDFLDVLFARVGFNYNTKIAGGETSWTSDRGSHLQRWSYSAMAVPVTVGVNVPLFEGKYNVYAGVGVTWASGGFELELKAPEGAFFAAANSPAAFGADDAGNLAPGRVGAIDEKAAIEGSAIGLGYVIGMDGELIEDLSLFIEAETQYVAKMSAAVAFSDPDSGQVFGSDKLAYPAIPGGQIIRIGVKYTFFTMD
jgi:opacity protein-like surface antigen